MVGGSVAQKAGFGGHTWVLLQYLLGLRRLGWDVLLLDRLDREMSRDAAGAPCPPAGSANARYLADVMERFGLAEHYCLMDDEGQAIGGIPRPDALRRVERSAALLNVMGFVADPELLEASRLKVFLDIDPGLAQMWCALGLHDAFAGHDGFVTIGERIGEPGCPIPTCGREWLTTRPPVVLDQWPATPPRPGPITTVGSWRGASGVVEFDGITYGHRVHEFRPLLELPRLIGSEFRMALAIDPGDEADRRRLLENGWRLVEPRAAAGDPDTYREFILASGAELMVAKSLYARSRCGWFSDRSACYLASGRPVVAQDTGLEGIYPTGEGLLTFTSPEEAAEAIRAVFADHDRHCAAAREIAEACFGSDHVLSALLTGLGVD